MHENPLFGGLSCNRGGEIRTRDLLNPMPGERVRWRPWLLSLSVASNWLLQLNDCGGRLCRPAVLVPDA